MTPPALSATLGRIARAADPDPPADGRLVTRFARTRDPEAFAELVRRLGPMVLGVCRRVTGDVHLADDAFQAAFLVLVRRAADVRPAEAVRAWLYGVAVRVAREARAVSARRRAREAPVPTLPDRADEAHVPPDVDALRALDEEVAALPEYLRAAVVLCELDGATRKDAAAQLGVPEGTLSSRLAKGRKLLADRLRKRGITACGLAVLAPVVVPARLTAAASGPAPAAVAALAHGVVRAMTPRRIPIASLVVGLIATAALAVGSSAEPPEPPVRAADPPRVAPPPRPAPAGPNRIVLCRGGEFVALDPTGKNEAKVVTGSPLSHSTAFAVSPDGKRVACLRMQGEADGDPPPITRLFVREFGTGGRLTVLEGDSSEYAFAWSCDGTQLAVSEPVEGPTPKDTKITHYLYTLATKARTPLKLPDNHAVCDWSRDGRYFLTTELRFGEGPPAAVWVMNRDGTPHKRLIAAKASFQHARFSPDGTRVLASLFVAPAEDEKENDRLEALDLSTRPLRVALVVIDAATAKATPLKDMPLNVDIMGFCWSPDGRRIAYTWRERHPPATVAADRETQSHLTVCDADGGNQLTILTDRGASESHVVLAGVDWR